MSERHIIIIGNREFATTKLGAFEANGILLKLKKIILPVIGEMVGEAKGATNVMDMDIKEALNVLAEKIDEDTMNNIVLPMFKISQTACLECKTKIDSPLAINKVFANEDGLIEMYELIFEVLKYNYRGFFVAAMLRFGNKDGAGMANK
jgi:hypothetical protein